MGHPILEGSGYKYYGMAWTSVLTVHAFVLFSYYDLEWKSAVIDSLTYNIIFSGLGLGFWYIVKYVEPDKDDLLKVISAHLFASFLSIMLWMIGANYVVKTILNADMKYLLFTSEAIAIRILIGIGFYLMIVLVYYLIHYYQDLQAKISSELQLRALIKDTELRALKSQINPHFIFNSLNSVSALTISAPEKAREMVIKLSDFMRFSLGSTEQDTTTLKGEMGNAEDYLDIEKVRFGDQLIFNHEIDPECLELMVPSMILQPLLENAIKYGVSESLAPVTIRMKAVLLNEELLIDVENNYESDSVPRKGEGIGLKNIAERLNLMFGARGRIFIEKHKELFKVTLQIPQKQLSHGS